MGNYESPENYSRGLLNGLADAIRAGWDDTAEGIRGEFEKLRKDHPHVVPDDVDAAANGLNKARFPMETADAPALETTAVPAPAAPPVPVPAPPAAPPADASASDAGKPAK